MVKLVSLEMPPKSLVKMAKTANATEDAAAVTMIPLRSHVTTTKRRKIQPTPLQLTLHSEETSEDAAAVDADVGTSHESLLQMVKLVSHDKLVSLEMPPKNLVKMAKTASAPEDAAAVTMILLRNHVTTTKRRKIPQNQATPQKLTLHSEETSDAAAVDADVGTSHESLLQMVKLVNHDKLVSLEMSPKSLVKMAKTA